VAAQCSWLLHTSTVAVQDLLDESLDLESSNLEAAQWSVKDLSSSGVHHIWRLLSGNHITTGVHQIWRLLSGYHSTTGVHQIWRLLTGVLEISAVLESITSGGCSLLLTGDLGSSGVHHI